MKIVLRTVAAILFIFCVIALLFANMALSPSSSDTKKISFSVEPGEGVSDSISKLSHAGLINNKFVFTMLYRMSGKHEFKKGTYELSPSMPPIKILRLLLKGSSSSLVKSSVKKKL